MNHNTKKKWQIAGKKSLAVGKMAWGASKIAGAYSSYTALSATIPFVEYALRRALIQNSCNKGLESIQAGAAEWQEAGTLLQVDLPDADTVKRVLGKAKST